MNKIEPGCRAVIVNSTAGNNGKVVTVLGIAGEPGLDGVDIYAKHGVRWRIDRLINVVSVETGKNKPSVDHIGENKLQRINDDDSRKVVSWEALKDIWVPEKEKELEIATH